MANETLLDILHQVRHGNADIVDLLNGIDAARNDSLESLSPLIREIGDLYSRGELTSEVYDALMGCINPATRIQSPTRQSRAALPESEPSVDRGLDVLPFESRQTAARRTVDSYEEFRDATEDRVDQLEAGSVINNRFVLEERIGAGGMGVVFRARDRYREEAHDRDPYVALKFLNSEFRRHPDSLMALEREARRHMKLAHPNIMTVHDFSRSADNSLIFLHMELLQGEPLDRLIRRHPEGLPFRDVLPLIEGAGRALTYAHEQGIIHSDFKPGNVFAVDPGKAKVLDFGIARVISVGASTNREGTLYDAGTLNALTPAYASPEMLLGDKPSPSDDIYALACVAHELMTGRHPFDGATAVKAAHEGLKIRRVPGMGRYQHRALVRGLAFRKADRSRSVEAFLDEFAGPLGVRGRALRKTLMIAAGTAVLVGSLSLAAVWYMRPNADERLIGRLMELAAARLEEQKQRMGDVEEADPEEVKSYIRLGQLQFEEATKNLDPGQLSENTASSAYASFNSALSKDVDNMEAAKGIVAIVRFYEVEADRRFDAKDYLGASEFAGYALEIDPDRESVQDIERQSRERLQSVSE